MKYARGGFRRGEWWRIERPVVLGFAGKDRVAPVKEIIRSGGLWNGIGKRCSERRGIDLGSILSVVYVIW